MFLGLTYWGRVTHICVSKITIIGSDNGLSPGRRQATIWTSVEILLIGPSGTNFSEILIEIYTFSFKKMHFKMLSGKLAAILSLPQCVNTLRPELNDWLVTKGPIENNAYMNQYTEPSHCLNQCWFIVNWTLGNNCQWNLNQNNIFIQENAFENVCKMVATLSRPQYLIWEILDKHVFKVLVQIMDLGLRDKPLTWANGDSVHLCKYASLGFNEGNCL